MEKFYDLVYDCVKLIPMGKVSTYSEIARAAGNPTACRAALNALHKSPDHNSIPCHRVVNSKGQLSKHFKFGGIKAQKELLEIEGVEVHKNKVDLEKYGFYFW